MVLSNQKQKQQTLNKQRGRVLINQSKGEFKMSELLKAQNFGIEVEFTGITREEAANAIAEVIGSSRITAPTPNCYHARKVIGPDGRKWTVERDSSIDPQRSQKSKAQNESYDEFRVEFVTPICSYDDIETIQNIIRKFKELGGIANSSCGMHVHIDGANHTATSLRRLCNFMVSRQSLILEAIGAGARASRWCKPISEDLLKAMKKNKDLTKEQLEAIWYSRANDGYTGTIDHQHYNYTRYHDVNLHAFFTKGTVEFRMFNSTLNADKVKAYIQLCLGLSAWSIESDENIAFRRKETLTADQKVVLMRHILINRLGLKGAEFKTCRSQMLHSLKDQATAQAVS